MDRGFSFLRDAPLDMRMAGGGATAADAVNCWPEAELGRVFRELGEERHWRGIARRWKARLQRGEAASWMVAVAGCGCAAA